jgi:acetamidase/formamidase
MIHLLEPTDQSMADSYGAERHPVLTIEPGDALVVRTLDAHGHLARQTVPGEVQPVAFPARRGHCLVGPIAVQGARPGDVLAIRVGALRPDSWGFTTSGGRDNVLQRRLGLDSAEPAWLLWDIDADTGVAVNQHGHHVPIEPFLGVMAVGLPEGAHSTIPPRAVGGGNIDCRSLVAGSTLFLPVATEGAMVYLGDGHAAQGDGELGGTAIECGMTTELTIDLLPSAPLDAVHAVTPDGRITFGFDADLNEAMSTALDHMVTWLAGDLKLPRAEALALASCVVDMRVTQVANETWGVHAVLDDRRLRNSAGDPVLPTVAGA